MGNFQKDTNTSMKIATKFGPLPWRFTSDNPVKALKVSHRYSALRQIYYRALYGEERMAGGGGPPLDQGGARDHSH